MIGKYPQTEKSLAESAANLENVVAGAIPWWIPGSNERIERIINAAEWYAYAKANNRQAIADNFRNFGRRSNR